jgi:hypothetical protein
MFYYILNYGKYDDVRPSFIFYCLIHEACTMILNRGDIIKNRFYGYLKLTSNVMNFIVLSI